MNILQIHNFYQIFAGEDNVVTAEKELLESKGHNVFRYSRDNNEIRNYNLKSKILFFFRCIYSKKTVSELTRIINEFKPDVVHVHNVFPLLTPSVYLCIKRHKIPVVQTIHNYRFLCPNGLFFIRGSICEKCMGGNNLHCVLKKCYKNSFALSFLYAIILWIYKKFNVFKNNIDLFIALSNFTKQKLISGGFPADKIVVEGNFLFKSDGEEGYGEYVKGDYAIYVGRLSEEKGVETLLRAVNEVREYNIPLKILGTGNLDEKLRHYVQNKSMKNVEFLGYISGTKKLELLRKARFSFVTSECYENFGLTTIESFVVGTPVLASRIGGVEELVEKGKSGLLFEPGDSHDLAKKIVYLFNHPQIAKDMGISGREFIKNFHSPETHYNNLYKIYCDVMKIGARNGKD